MNAWHDFFLAQAGAAGVLTGLVFVGVSINLQKIVSDPNSGLVGRAAEALILLVAVLTVSVFVLVPGQGAGLLGAEVLVVGLAACGWIAAIQLPRLREWGTMRADLRVSFVLRVVLGQVATLTLVIAGVAVLWVGPGGSTGWWRARSSRSWRLWPTRGCCSSRSTARSTPGLPTALFTGVRGIGILGSSQARSSREFALSYPRAWGKCCPRAYLSGR